MAESAVTYLLDKLASLASDGTRQLKGVWEEVHHLRWELERLLACLRDADTELNEYSHEELKTWVQQVRDVAHDAEDVIDEFTILAEHDHGAGIYGCINQIRHCVKNVKANYRISVSLGSINSRISSIFSARKRLITKLDTASLAKSGSASWHARRDDAVLFDETDLVGVDKPKKQIIKWLVNCDPKRKVVSVDGMGGIGKSALVKTVFDDLEVKKHFKRRVWIKVSQFSTQAEFFRNLIQSIAIVIRRSIVEDVDSMTNVDEMKVLIKSLLQERRYLIVLDDIWTVSEWEAIKLSLPNNFTGSRVLLTTCKADVASVAARTDFNGEVYNLAPLSEVESWELFQRGAFRGKPCPSYLFEICRSILRSCEGLPLAIVALSGILATKDKRRIDEWDLIRSSLGAELHGNDKLEDLKRVLFLSINDLPSYLKSCFLHLSIFPEGSIKRMRIIRLWISEGFVEAKVGKTMEEVAQDYLDELLNRNLIQVATTKTDGRVKAYRVHGLFREIVISKSREQNFAALVKSQDALWPERARRLSLHNVSPPPQQQRAAYQLRSFFMFGVVEKSSLKKFFPVGFKFLRVLDMEGLPLKIFPMEIVDLHYLRHLSLRKTKVKLIPRSIGRLKNLEILDLKHTMVVELPAEILKLQKLRHLLVYRYETNKSYAQFDSRFGFKAFLGMSTLQSLQQLCFIEASQACSLIMSELMNLTQLRRLGIMKVRKQDGLALCSSIEQLTSLRVLSIKSTEESEEIDLKCLNSPPRFLERLYLMGRLEEFPHWISSLSSLSKLFLKWSRLKEDPLLHLQELPNLVHLELLQAYDGDSLHFKAQKFQKLKLLGLDLFDKLRSVEVGKGAMPCLEKLIIQRCNLLQSVPSGIESLYELKVVDFFDMPNELIEKLKGEDSWRVEHVPEVYSTYWRDGGWDVYSIESIRDQEKKSLDSTAMRSHRRQTLWKV